MNLNIIPYGPLSSNMYLLDTDSGIFLIDPSVYPERLKEEDLPERIDYIFMTHGHFDHVNALDKWCELYPDAKAYISSEDMSSLTDSETNCSSIFAEKCKYKTIPEDFEKLDLDFLKVLKTPGHTRGGVCLLFDVEGQKLLFTGDTLFAGSCGRSDLPGGNNSELMESLRMLSKLDADILVYPGHGPSTSIGNECRSNPFFNL